jgi:hypothetical protein
VIAVALGESGMSWTESVELSSCIVKRRSSATWLIIYFLLQNATNRTVNGDMPWTASIWLGN